jgi:hypothetical protein
MKRLIAFSALAAAVCFLGFAKANAQTPVWNIFEQANTGFTTIAGYAPALAMLNGPAYMAWAESCEPEAGSASITHPSTARDRVSVHARR